MEMYARVREARRCTGLSQEDFAALVEVSRGAVAQWEMEQGTTPSVKNLAEIARRSGVCFEWIATGRGPKKHGEPVLLREEAAPYGDPLSDEERAVVGALKRMKPAQRAALVTFLTIAQGK